MKPSNESGDNDVTNLASANPGYALGQLAAAFAASQEHADPATRDRATRKIHKWTEVFKGMLSGALRVGSRTPLTDTPAWATLEIIRGGCATGDLLAAGALQPHEEELLRRLDVASTTPPRAAINSYYLSDEGIAELQRMLTTGCYRMNVPEEGALLVVAWLLAHSQLEAARDLLDQISSHLAQLRFYPVPNARPLPDESFVHLRTIGETLQDLKAIKVPTQIQVQREATMVWAPLLDRAVDLFLETLEGPIPAVKTDSDGRPLRTATGKFSVEGGWPCQRYPEGWNTRARTVILDYQRLRKENKLCGKPERPGENFALLRHYLEICIADPQRLTGRDVGTIRQVLASIVTRRGTPDSERCRRLREWQGSQANRPTNVDLANVVMDRISAMPPDDGLSAIDAVLAPITVVEAAKRGIAPGQLLPERLGEKVRRCLVAPAEVLVELGVITSAEVLATVIPQITAQVRSQGLADPDLRRLDGAIYRAFRRRRSLLLLNLESQVKLAELPWDKAIDAHRRNDAGTEAVARETLRQVVLLAITGFPHQILPNKLLQEIRALADGAGLHIPLVDEVAADIFMGAFSEKFLRAAQLAAQLLEGSLYERYYGFSYVRIRDIDDVKPVRREGTPTSPAFFQLCSELAGSGGDGSWVARNGTIIEQEQILTTHNLAVLFTALGLADTLSPRLGELARSCFTWICRRHQQPPSEWKARLHMVKNTAYAWRQMVFFLALASPDSVQEFLTWASEHLADQTSAFQTRFQPALLGLARATQGLAPEEAGGSTNPGSARRFLGWTTTEHWLIS